MMESWKCTKCGYLYSPVVGDSERGIAKGTAFEDLPADWTCPRCGVGKDKFVKVEKA